MKYKYDPPALLKKVFSQFHWNTSNSKVLLTFDDGPDPDSTPVILEQLNKYSLKALFFCVGENLQRYPDLAQQIIESGHVIGSHTFSHKNIRKLLLHEVKNELEEFNKVYNDLIGTFPKYFRPPYGRFTINLRSLLKSYGMQNVMWSLLTYDYKNELNILKFAVTNYLSPDSIIVLHDSKKSLETITDALDFIYREVVERKYEFGDPAECLR